LICFFFQAEDGIRDGHVTGVQTCALPICFSFSTSSPTAQFPSGSQRRRRRPAFPGKDGGQEKISQSRKGQRICRTGVSQEQGPEIGRASCRDRREAW